MEWGILMAAISLFGTLALAVADAKGGPDGDHNVHHLPRRSYRKLRKAA